MKGVESGFGLCVNVCSLLVKVFDCLKVTHVSCVQERRKSFLVFLVEPVDDLLSVIFLVDFFQTLLYLGLPAIEFYSVVNVEFYDIEVVLVSQFV